MFVSCRANSVSIGDPVSNDSGEAARGISARQGFRGLEIVVIVDGSLLQCSSITLDHFMVDSFLLHTSSRIVSSFYRPALELIGCFDPLYINLIRVITTDGHVSKNAPSAE
ncbi:hypothetical protein Pdw03_5913 [Penicillium digitatum]|uniref:Uncharacterized protein n=1 Tax=Penicillium digitatum TaxID=36651 RepID=A0A7T6XVS1_PENDI|nr:hypothetical protein Pdw03_5913 [Penicillium digitatum]